MVGQLGQPFALAIAAILVVLTRLLERSSGRSVHLSQVVRRCQVVVICNGFNTACFRERDDALRRHPMLVVRLGLPTSERLKPACRVLLAELVVGDDLLADWRLNSGQDLLELATFVRAAVCVCQERGLVVMVILCRLNRYLLRRFARINRSQVCLPWHVEPVVAGHCDRSRVVVIEIWLDRDQMRFPLVHELILLLVLIMVGALVTWARVAVEDLRLLRHFAVCRVLPREVVALLLLTDNRSREVVGGLVRRRA